MAYRDHEAIVKFILESLNYSYRPTHTDELPKSKKFIHLVLLFLGGHCNGRSDIGAIFWFSVNMILIMFLEKDGFESHGNAQPRLLNGVQIAKV